MAEQTVDQLVEYWAALMADRMAAAKADLMVAQTVASTVGDSAEHWAARWVD